jgi:hypothetical protein
VVGPAHSRSGIVVVQSAARATMARGTAMTGNFIDIALDQEGAGNGHLQRLAQTAQKLAQHQAQAAELLETILTLEIVTGMKSDHGPVVSYYRRPAANRARATLFTWVCSFN